MTRYLLITKVLADSLPRAAAKPLLPHLLLPMGRSLRRLALLRVLPVRLLRVLRVRLLGMLGIVSVRLLGRVIGLMIPHRLLVHHRLLRRRRGSAELGVLHVDRFLLRVRRRVERVLVVDEVNRPLRRRDVAERDEPAPLVPPVSGISEDLNLLHLAHRLEDPPHVVLGVLLRDGPDVNLRRGFAVLGPGLWHGRPDAGGRALHRGTPLRPRRDVARDPSERHRARVPLRSQRPAVRVQRLRRGIRGWKRENRASPIFVEEQTRAALRHEPAGHPFPTRRRRR
mmetsp:Transcript_203/g.846  ORF Transcript_203/g.846 Transcript_203/m.846 type:complete len:283 (+) Transcript_203:1219-2067(+)